MSDIKISRRRARRRAVEILFGLCFEAPLSEEGLAARLTDVPSDPGGHPLDEESQAFASALVRGVWRDRTNLDAVISEHAKGWKLSRIGGVELTILRLGVYELLGGSDAPAPVVVNEALELAKSYADPSCLSFVNGILDAIVRQKGLSIPKSARPAPKNRRKKA